ncbi:DedA family protein [Phaeovibrio sulfidiphilus]|uniref:DedA family protein n=1 Tax=Phaeovibrio sulfidiphilus TaxID=1220600 RepID=A0A8J6YMX9_9PROT|nr:YqaA family protein [Phaeovibrio sulfidiphilus]MBE1236266.1 DedA family protein [Phaeovibrio sulfidiphilus]
MPEPEKQTWTRRLIARANSRSALVWLGVISCIESIFLPMTADVLLIPMILANRSRWVFLCLYTAATSVLGGLFGWLIGYFLMETVGFWLIDLYSAQDVFRQFTGLVDRWGALAVFIAGVSPIPYKVATVTAGAAQMNLVVFLLASVVSRALRFLVVGVVFALFGHRALDFYMAHRRRIHIAGALALLVAGAAALAALLLGAF